MISDKGRGGRFLFEIIFNLVFLTDIGSNKKFQTRDSNRMPLSNCNYVEDILPQSLFRTNPRVEFVSYFDVIRVNIATSVLQSVVVSKKDASGTR